MSYPYLLHEQAHEEYIIVYEWYELKLKGLGERFAKSVEKRLTQISEYPEYYGKKNHLRFREAKVEHFLYMIVYEFFSRKQMIHIAAIYHMKRNSRRKYRNFQKLF